MSGCKFYNTIQYNTIQYNTIQYNTMQYNTIQAIIIILGCFFVAKLKDCFGHLNAFFGAGYL